MKYNYFDKEQKSKKAPENPFASDNLFYNKEQDCYYCPMGQQMRNIRTFSKKRKQRCWDVEAVFGNIKQNMNFKRFMLRGIEKVTIETGLIALAHNLKKYTHQLEV